MEAIGGRGRSDRGPTEATDATPRRRADDLDQHGGSTGLTSVYTDTQPLTLERLGRYFRRAEQVCDTSRCDDVVLLGKPIASH